MKPLWTGSDVLFLIKYPPSKKRKYIYMFCYRIFAKILDFFAQEHYVVSSHLVKELSTVVKKPIKVLPDPPLFTKKVQKIGHPTFNVMYYRPKTNNQIFTDWVYGYDIIQEVKKEVDADFVELDGTFDMEEVYAETDFYLRPNRHDGNPRMVMECAINNIPYYWTYENPNKEDIIREIKRCQNSKF